MQNLQGFAQSFVFREWQYQSADYSNFRSKVPQKSWFLPPWDPWFIKSNNKNRIKRRSRQNYVYHPSFNLDGYSFTKLWRTNFWWIYACTENRTRYSAYNGWKNESFAHSHTDSDRARDLELILAYRSIGKRDFRSSGVTRKKREMGN